MTLLGTIDGHRALSCLLTENRYAFLFGIHGTVEVENILVREAGAAEIVQDVFLAPDDVIAVRTFGNQHRDSVDIQEFEHVAVDLRCKGVNAVDAVKIQGLDRVNGVEIEIAGVALVQALNDLFAMGAV